jgi:dienelactone hydrolase
VHLGRRMTALCLGAITIAGVAVGTSASAASSARTHAATTPRVRQEPVVVTDVSVSVPGQQSVNAWLVRPSGHAGPRTLAGVIYLHWLEPPASTQNRSEFLDEAVRVAEHGAVAILPDLTFPWTGQVFGDERDVASVRAQEAAVDATYRALLVQPGVNPNRTAVVGHDYGAMYGSILSAHEPTIKAEVFMAGDATWADWFSIFFLSLDSVPPAYNALFAGLDPVDNVSRMRAHLYFQWSGQDPFVTPDVRAAFEAADPQAKVSLYPDAGHFLDQNAKDERIPWVLDELGLR